jgi:cell division protein FtsL
MYTLKSFFQVPLVKFTVHLVLVLGLVLNIYNLYSWYRVNSNLNKDLKNLSDLAQLNSESKNEQGYYNTDLYKEKYAKDSGFKNKSEDVIDTSLVETNDNKNPDFVPKKEVVTVSNIEKWLYCFFGGGDTTVKRETAGFSPECKVS